MKTYVIDASVALKWVVEEDGTDDALALRGRARLIAPELFVAECANILWKKTRLGELTGEEAFLAARLLQASEVEFVPARMLLEPATRMAIALDHPAYDCLYLALAIERGSQFVTADGHLLRKLRERHRRQFGNKAIALADAARA